MPLDDLEYLDGQPRRATPKPSRGARLRLEAKQQRVRRLTRSQLRVQVVREDLSECRRCHLRVWLRLKDAPTPFMVANVHEWIPKSLGGDDLDPLNCLTLCGFCHPLFTEHRLEIVALDPVRLMRGSVEFIMGGNPLKEDRVKGRNMRRSAAAALALVLLVLVGGCRRPGHFTDSTTTWDAALRAHPETGCGYVAGRVPGRESVRMIPVYHRGTGHIALYTRYAWCPGNQLFADDVGYPLGFTPKVGDIITCAWDGEALDPQTDLEIKNEDRPR